LIYVSDAAPGIRRVRRGRGFAYRGIDGRWLRDAQELARIRRLAIPPAYRDVWICTLPQGHLQATGRDARGRKQYRYHADWQRERDSDKFARLQAFGAALPRIRARIAQDLEQARQPTRRAVLAALLRLLDTTLLRVGNEEYARLNGSYGLTTLHNRHAAVRGSTLHLCFRGKSGVLQQAALDDPCVARIVHRCQSLPGQALFEYQAEDGSTRCVGSADVNDYLREIAGAQFSAKDFRTWHASALALALLRDGHHSVKEALAEVAKRLGNTPAVCRKSYVHPRVLDTAARPPLVARARRGLTRDEAALLAFLEADA
jgi:DNA topoisomerase-1